MFNKFRWRFSKFRKLPINLHRFPVKFRRLLFMFAKLPISQLALFFKFRKLPAKLLKLDLLPVKLRNLVSKFMYLPVRLRILLFELRPFVKANSYSMSGKNDLIFKFKRFGEKVYYPKILC